MRVIVDAVRLGVDQEQRDAVATLDVAGRARRDDQPIGDVAVEHVQLAAAELELAAAAGARVAMLCGAWRFCSSDASATMSSPPAIAGSNASFCAAVPPRSNAVTPSTAVDSNGVALRLRPISSAISPAPT